MDAHISHTTSVTQYYHWGRPLIAKLNLFALSPGPFPLLQDFFLTTIKMSSLDSAIAPVESKDADWAEDTDQLDGSVNIPPVGADQEAVSMIEEPEFDVEVKLVDSNSPLYSVKSFEELGL